MTQSPEPSFTKLPTRTIWWWVAFVSILLSLVCFLWWGASFVYHLITFHPTGQIVFACWPERLTSRLCMVNADGTDYRQVTFKTDKWPSWSPDGERIVFAREIYDEGFPTILFVMNRDGSGLTQLTDASVSAVVPSWLPSGDQIAFTYFKKEDKSSGIALVNPQGGRVAFLTSSSEMQPRWSQDGKLIAYVKYVITNGMVIGQHIYVMNADGSNQRQLTGIYSDSPSWSPDGTKLAFTGSGGVWEINADGSGLTQVTTSRERSPSWSPDGQYIVYTKSDPWCLLCPGTGQLWIMRADGSQQTRLTNGPVDENPAWGPLP